MKVDRGEDSMMWSDAKEVWKFIDGEIETMTVLNIKESWMIFLTFLRAKIHSEKVSIDWRQKNLFKDAIWTVTNKKKGKS